MYWLGFGPTAGGYLTTSLVITGVGSCSLLWVTLNSPQVFLLYKQKKNKKITIVAAATPFSEFVVRLLGSKIKGYKPTLWLPFSSMKNAYHGDKKIPSMNIYRRVECTMQDGEVLAVDFYPREFRTMPEDRPLIVFIPGVFGMSQDVYSAEFCQMVHKTLGWRTAVFNRRGYGGMPIKGKRVVGLTSYDDIHEVLGQIQEMLPSANLYLVGVSLGAANTQRYLSDFNHESIVKAAVTISSPWNAHKVSEVVKNNPVLRMGIHQYQKKLFKEQLMHDTFNRLLEAKSICPTSVLNTKDNKHFDHICSTIGLDHAKPEDYYQALSSYHLVDKIRIPVLSFNSSDDLLIPKEVVPFSDIEKNRRIVHLQVAGGGHTEYYTGCKAQFVGVVNS